MLKSRSGNEKIFFENIVAPEFTPQRNQGITKKDAMATIHVSAFPVLRISRFVALIIHVASAVKVDGSIVKGMEALELLYGQVGLGWVFVLSRLPLLGQAAELIYKFISKNRVSIGGGMDAVMALGKINMEEKGEGSCAEDGECRDGYSKPSEDAEPPPAPAAANAGAAAAAPGAEPAIAPAAVIRGSALDRLHIFGVYLAQGAGSGQLMAAPVDIETGQLLGEKRTLPLRDTSVETVAEGVKELLAASDWRGVVGVSLPGLLRHAHEDGPEDSSAAPYVMSAKDRRHARVTMEEELQEATGKELIVLSGAEANGYGELLYGAAKGLRGLTMVIMLGRGIGVALFDNGVLVRNAEFSKHVAGWGDAKWADATCPPPTTLPDSPAWARWAKRVSVHLTALDTRFKPDHIVLGGSGSRALEVWRPMLAPISAPIVHAALNETGESGVLGSAAGGGIQLQLRDDLARVRAAVGRTQGTSPQRLTVPELERVFRSFGAHPLADDAATLVLNYNEMAAAIAALGVKLTAEEAKETMLELDTRAKGQISFDDFLTWWQDLIVSSPVALIHTKQEYDTLMEEELTSGRLLVLEVGFTFCVPCKKFAPVYKDCAAKYTDARFAYMSGNENAETVTVGRDILGVTGSPAFFMYRNGVQVAKFSGAKEDQLVDFIERNIAPASALGERAGSAS